MFYFNSQTVRWVQFELTVSQVVETFPTVVVLQSARGQNWSTNVLLPETRYNWLHRKKPIQKTVYTLYVFCIVKLLFDINIKELCLIFAAVAVICGLFLTFKGTWL